MTARMEADISQMLLAHLVASSDSGKPVEVRITLTDEVLAAQGKATQMEELARLRAEALNEAKAKATALREKFEGLHNHNLAASVRAELIFMMKAIEDA